MRVLLIVGFVIAVLAVIGFGLAWFGVKMDALRRRPEDPKESPQAPVRGRRDRRGRVPAPDVRPVAGLVTLST